MELGRFRAFFAAALAKREKRSMIYLALFLLIGAGASHWAAKREAKKHGETVSTRRWETTLFYRDDDFIGWLSSGSPSVQGYAQVLVPYDMALLSFLGGAIAAGSLAAAEALHCVSGGRWLLLLAPLAFGAADFFEDRILLKQIAMTQSTPAEVLRLKKATLAKFIALGAAVNQAVILGLWAWFA
jgi:hypothetical protein